MDSFDKYISQLTGALQTLDKGPIRQAADLIFETWVNRGAIWIFGNGGSWSTAGHFVNDLRKLAHVHGAPYVRAMSLTEMPLFTAIANDHSYSETFVRELNSLMQNGDLAIGISTSGRSPNVLRALQLASRWGKRILLTGSSIYQKGPYADVVISVPSDEIRIVEDIHLAVCHMLAGELRRMTKMVDKHSEKVHAAV
jgi:D-sedoheptulose 7-phosphate isomerase